MLTMGATAIGFGRITAVVVVILFDDRCGVGDTTLGRIQCFSQYCRMYRRNGCTIRPIHMVVVVEAAGGNSSSHTISMV